MLRTLNAKVRMRLFVLSSLHPFLSLSTYPSLSVPSLCLPLEMAERGKLLTFLFSFRLRLRRLPGTATTREARLKSEDVAKEMERMVLGEESGGEQWPSSFFA